MCIYYMFMFCFQVHIGQNLVFFPKILNHEPPNQGQHTDGPTDYTYSVMVEEGTAGPSISVTTDSSLSNPFFALHVLIPLIVLVVVVVVVVGIGLLYCFFRGKVSRKWNYRRNR